MKQKSIVECIMFLFNIYECFGGGSHEDQPILSKKSLAHFKKKEE